MWAVSKELIRDAAGPTVCEFLPITFLGVSVADTCSVLIKTVYCPVHKASVCSTQVVKEVTDDALRPSIPEDLPTPAFPGQDEYIVLMKDCWQQVC